MFERKYQRFKWLINKFVIINIKFNFRGLRLNIVKWNITTPPGNTNRNNTNWNTTNWNTTNWNINTWSATYLNTTNLGATYWIIANYWKKKIRW